MQDRIDKKPSYAAQASKVKLRARLAAAPPDLRADIASSDSAGKYLSSSPHQRLKSRISSCSWSTSSGATLQLGPGITPCGRRVLVLADAAYRVWPITATGGKSWLPGAPGTVRHRHKVQCMQ